MLNSFSRSPEARRRSRALTAALAAFAALTATAAPALASPELRVDGRHFKDSGDGVVVLRGVNAAGDSKVPPFRPVKDAAFFAPLEGWGFNVVRLLFTWEGFEPSKGQYDSTYLEYYVNAVRGAAAHNLYVIVDFHQDAFSRFTLGGCGEGFPKWALPPSITPAAPDNGPSCADWGPRMLGDANMAAAWDSFYADEIGARTAYLAMIKAVAATLDKEPNVIGYDLLNEPWGDEVTQIGPLYQDAAKAIREVSPSAILFLCPRALVSAGNPTELVDPKISNSVYAPHFYDASVVIFKSWSKLPPDKPFQLMLGTAEAWGVPMLLGEMGAAAGTERGLAYVDSLYAHLDDAFASGTQWVYTPGWTDAAKDGWNTEDFSIVDDKGQTRDNFRARPYPRRVSGNPVEFTVSYEDAKRARVVALTWENDPATGETEIFVPFHDYFGGSTVALEASGEGLTCDRSTTLVTCTSKVAGEMRVQLKASPDPGPLESSTCGLTGIEMLLLLPLLAVKLRNHGGNVSRTADAIGVSRQALYRWIERYNLRGDR